MSSPAPLHIVIIGAGIAGLAAARALREHDVTVLEQSRMKSEIGAAIHLGPNASKIALKWGLDLANLNSPECNVYKEFTLAGVRQIEAKADTRAAFGAPWLLNHRVDLHNELRRLAEDASIPGEAAKIRSAARVVSIDCAAGTVALDGGEVLHADVIIGADGIRSVTRTAVLGVQTDAVPTGHSAYRTLLPREKILADPKLAFLLDEGAGSGIVTYVGVDRRVVLYPCRGYEYLNVVGIIPDGALTTSSGDSWNAEVPVSELISAFSTFSEDVQRLLSYATSVGLWQLRDLAPLSTWVNDKVILIGDASHAMLPHQGQGAGQSIEDAEALGALLTGAAAKDVPALLKLVESVRKERASTIQRYSREKALGSQDGEIFTLNASEFVPYNFSYSGAVAWAQKQNIALPAAVLAA
ncbi:hypothetical protein RQP46_010898 [Phenoliferia psychrophenolica]